MPRKARSDVLWIEDETETISIYHDKFRSDRRSSAYNLSLCPTLDDAISRLTAALSATPCGLDAIILDLQFGWSDKYPRGEIQQFNDLSGVWLLDRFAASLALNRVSLLVFTRQSASVYATPLASVIARHNFPLACHKVVLKRDVNARTIVNRFVDFFELAQGRWA